MKIHRKQSIRKSANLIPIFLIILIIINMTAVSLIGYFYFSINKSEAQSSEYFRDLNSYVLLILNSEGLASVDLKENYEFLLSLFNRMDPQLRFEAELDPPDYSGLAGQEQYSAKLRDHASILRQNLSIMIERSYLRIAIMLSLSIIASIVLLSFMIVFIHSIKLYLNDMSFGLEYLKKILKFESRPEFQNKETKIVEVEELNDALTSLSMDISYNNKLIESNTHGNLYLVLSDLFTSFQTVMSCDRMALAFIDSSDRCIAESAVTSYNDYLLRPGFIEKISSTSLGKIIESGQPRIINDLRTYASLREISHSTSLLLQEGIKSSITVPMFFDEKCLGFFFVSSRKKNAYSTTDLNYAQRVINLLKQKFYTEYLLQQVISETSNAFVGLMEEKDNETSSHISRMSQYSYITARAYNQIISTLSPNFMREILWFSPLHDIGKVGIPDRILLKEGPLTHDEMEIMKGHVDIGVRVIKKMNRRLKYIVSTPLLQTAVEIIAGHHEKANGRGYPLGLKNEEIPLAGRIVAIADVFDALTSKRPYKEAYDIEKALDIIENRMRESFDSDVIKAFKFGLPEIRKVYEELKEI